MNISDKNNDEYNNNNDIYGNGNDRNNVNKMIGWGWKRRLKVKQDRWDTLSKSLHNYVINVKWISQTTTRGK